jgi:hypothetical protein
MEQDLSSRRTVDVPFLLYSVEMIERLASTFSLWYTTVGDRSFFSDGMVSSSVVVFPTDRLLGGWRMCGRYE